MDNSQNPADLVSAIVAEMDNTLVPVETGIMASNNPFLSSPSSVATSTSRGKGQKRSRSIQGQDGGKYTTAKVTKAPQKSSVSSAEVSDTGPSQTLPPPWPTASVARAPFVGDAPLLSTSYDRGGAYSTAPLVDSPCSQARHGFQPNQWMGPQPQPHPTMSYPPPEVLQAWNSFLVNQGNKACAPSAALGAPPMGPTASVTSEPYASSECSQGPTTMSVCMDNIMHSLSDISDDDNDDRADPKARDTCEEHDQFTEILDDIGGSFEHTATVGPHIHEKLANLANMGFRTFMAAEKTQDLCAKYLNPGNCPKMTVPRTNQEIYSSLRGHGEVQALDRSLQKSQQLILKAGTPLLQIMDMFLKHDPSQQFPLHDAMRTAGDAFKLLTASFGSLTMRRRELIKPHLQGRYKKICHQNNPVTDYLFGSDLSQQVKEISDSGKLDLVRKHQQQEPSRNFRGRGPYTYSNPRRGQHQPQTKRNFLEAKPLPRPQWKGRPRNK